MAVPPKVASRAAKLRAEIEEHNHAYYVIDALLCTECVGAEDEPQCMLVCPADCIVEDPDFRESKEELLEKYKGIHG